MMMAVLGTGAVTTAQDGAMQAESTVTPASENAALHYWRAWWVIGQEQLEKATPDVAGPFGADPDTAASDTPPDLSEETRVLLSLVENVAKIEHCDFGAAAPVGVDAILFTNGHLEPAERSGAALLHDARILLAEGNSGSAANRVLASLRLGEHLARDRNEASHAVAVRMTGRCEAFIAASGSEFSDEDRKTISRAFDRFEERDPLYFADSIRREALESERFLLAETDGGMFDPEADLEEPTHQTVARAMEEHGSAGLARAAIRRDIVLMRKLSEAYAGLVDEMSDDSRFDALRDRARNGDFGPFARTTFSLLQDQRAQDMRARRGLNQLRAWANGETETLELPEEEEQ